jgi:uncharacterized protein YjbI with pentapeptide repeats
VYQQLQSRWQRWWRWQPTRRQLLWAGVIAALALLIIVICGYLFEWPWTGLTSSEVPQNTQPTKTLWDWLDLLIVPVVLAIGGYLFNSSQNQATQVAADQRAQDEALQAYLDHMSDMLLPNNDHASLYSARPDTLDDSLSSVARARTLTLLSRIDGERKARVVQFLYETGLIYKYHIRRNEENLLESRDPIVILEGADLSKTTLSGAVLPGAFLSGAVLNETNLSWATLYKATLGTAKLRKANLSSAYMDGAILVSADLTCANLSGAGLVEAILGGANLSKANLSGVSPLENLGLGADLSRANLIGADLSGAILTGVNFRNANLSEAQVTEEQLGQASSLEGATMPNGQKYEDWLKSRGEENSGSS